MIRFFVLISFTLFMLSSCSKNGGLDRRCENNWTPNAELQDEIQAVIDAAVKFGEDPTTENCNAYKEAALEYLDEIKEWEECYIFIGQGQEYQDAIEDAERDVENIDC